MATTGIVNGTDLRFYLGGTVIGHATSCSISMSMEPREILTKDLVGSFTSAKPGRRSFSGSAEGLVAFDAPGQKVSDLVTAYLADDALLIRFTTDVNGDTYWEGSVHITSVELGAPVEDNSTYSVAFTGVGALTQGTES